MGLPCTLWVYPIIGYMPFSGPAYGKAKAHVSQALKTLDAHLLDKTYMVGEAMTLADITIASALVYPAKLAMDPKFRAQFPNVFRWFDLCVHQPQFVAVIGDVALAESEMKPEGASSAPQGGKKEAKKDEHPLKILDKKSPSPLNGDEWKRTYKNNPPEVWKKKLWEMFDPKGWALWVCRFKYNH